MGVGLGGRVIGGYRYFTDKGVCKDAEGNNHGVNSRDTDMQNLYRQR